jgi:signal transduction histidine kinase
MRQYLLREAPADQHAAHLQALEREAERLEHLVESMLELARFDAGSIKLSLEAIDLNRLAADVVVRYDTVAKTNGITLAMTPAEALNPIQADAAYIARALGILLDNAIRHTSEGGHVTIRLSREAWTGGSFAAIHVKDTGMGIVPEALPHVFDRFFRSERARNSGMSGVGLSLAIAYEIITRHNGDITVESQINQGSTFTIWLPE